MSLYDAVKAIAKKKNTSIYRIEHDLQLSNGRISKWDKSIPRADSLQQVADYLGVTPQYLFRLSGKEKVHE